MTPLPGRPEPSAEVGVDEGLRTVRLVVMVFLAIDLVSTPVGQAYGIPELGPSGPLAFGQGVLALAAVAAAMWHRPRLALGLTILALGPGLVIRFTGAEVYVLLVTGVMAGARARPVLLGWVLLGQLGYAVGVGLRVEQRNAGEGWLTFVQILGFAVVADAIGLVARRFLRDRDRRRVHVHELRREQAEIRARERARLADDLQAVVTDGLAAIDRQIDAATGRSSDVDGLRSGLARIEERSRTLLTELRVLLEMLRRDPVTEIPAAALGTTPWVELLTARHVRNAATVVFGLLAGRAVLSGLGTGPDADLGVQVLSLVGCAVAVWRPHAGAVVAVLALAVAAVLDAPGDWTALPVLLVCLIGASRAGTRRFWIVLLPVTGYAVLRGVTNDSDPVRQVTTVAYRAVAGILLGLAARSFADVQRDGLRQLGAMVVERDRVPVEERRGAARELHDVVAHQLSLTTMLVMAAGPTEDPAVLADTLDQVRRRTGAAHHELATLLAALRGPDLAPAGPMPLVTPCASAHALAERLVEHGHHPVLDLDAAADALDPTTQRTLSRVLQESTTNLLRYAPAGSTCHVGLAANDAGVRLTVASPLAATPRTSDLSLGWGLRGLRERVDLSQGSFAAGPDGDGRWVVSVTLPAAAAPANPGAHPART